MAESLRVDLLAVPHGFFTRRGGVSTGPFASLNCSLSSKDDRGAVLENRGRVADAVGVPRSHLLGCTQVHGIEVAHVESPWPPGAGPRADAMVSRRPGLALGIVTADCAPVLFADPGAGVVGAAHAGWRGALAGVLEATLAAMTGLGAHADRIVAAVGPCIGQASYEVAADLRDAVLARDPADARFFADGEREARWQFDLKAYCAARLRAAGVAEVTVVANDTLAEEERFFSHRRRTWRVADRLDIRYRLSPRADPRGTPEGRQVDEKRARAGQGSALKPARGFAPWTPSKGRGPLQSIHSWWFSREANRDLARSGSAPLENHHKSMVPRAAALGGDPRDRVPWWGPRAKPRLLLATLLCLAASPLHAAPPCQIPDNLALHAISLPAAKREAAADQRLVVLTFGGVRNAGAGAEAAGETYPAHLRAELSAALPHLKITVVNEPPPGGTSADVPAALPDLIAKTGARLVIWAPGGRDVASAVPIDTFQTAVRNGIDATHHAGADLILLDLTFLPAPGHIARAEPYRRTLAAVAATNHVPLLPRNALMRQWSEDGTLNLAARGAEEREQVVRHLFVCVAQGLAGPIAAAMR